MDAWGFGIFIVGTLAYFLSKRKPIFLFVAGTGLGIVIGAVWAMSIFNRAFGIFAP